MPSTAKERLLSAAAGEEVSRAVRSEPVFGANTAKALSGAAEGQRATTAKSFPSEAKNACNNDANNSHHKVCWIEVKQYPYQPDHQVELLHLQAEADALLIKLQAKGQRQLSEQTAAPSVKN
ncbi:MAG: hypothetical protein HC800_05720 [Phormidesmis sp. RL_2_1]|nr:hypothetical protein [Phormidesmis sp. RL_2_1]